MSGGGASSEGKRKITFAAPGTVQKPRRECSPRRESDAWIGCIAEAKPQVPIAGGGVPTDEGLRGDLYKDDIGLWGYFVEGALVCPRSA